jgi:tol-pal system protein YbgF
MNSPRRSTRRLLGLGFLLSVAQVFAAVPIEDRSSSSSSSSSSRPQLRPTPVVVEPSGSDIETPRSQPSAGVEPAPSGLAQLFSELQTLRSEVQELRSTVEEQNHKIRQLETNQQEQYRDLDGRVAQMSSGAGAEATRPASSGAGTPASSGASRVDQPVGGNPGTPSTAVVGGAGAAGEKAAYAAAFESMKTRQFDKSIEQFSRLIQDYPNGEMTPGSYYWLGELYLAKANMDQSRQSFAQVIDLYPTHNKAPDALYKLGVVNHRQGDNQKALEFLDRVQRDFPTSAAAGLAKTYASELR